MQRFVVGVRRELRDSVDLSGCLRDIPGIAVAPSQGSARAIVEATPATIEALRERHGDKLLIEPELQFYPAAKP